MTNRLKINRRAMIKARMARRVEIIVIMGAEIVTAGTVIPVWTSLVGCGGPAALAGLFWWSRP